MTQLLEFFTKEEILEEKYFQELYFELKRIFEKNEGGWNVK